MFCKQQDVTAIKTTIYLFRLHGFVQNLHVKIPESLLLVHIYGKTSIGQLWASNYTMPLYSHPMSESVENRPILWLIMGVWPFFHKVTFTKYIFKNCKLGKKRSYAKLSTISYQKHFRHIYYIIVLILWYYIARWFR